LLDCRNEKESGRNGLSFGSSGEEVRRLTLHHGHRSQSSSDDEQASTWTSTPLSFVVTHVFFPSTRQTRPQCKDRHQALQDVRKHSGTRCIRPTTRLAHFSVTS
jgi:hypothetical protein